MKNIKPYKLVSQKCWTLPTNSVTKLDWNEGDYRLSEVIKKELIDFIENKPLNWYPNLVDESIYSKLLIHENNIVNRDMIQYYPGSDSIHRTVVNALLKKGNTVLIITPSYDNFRYLCEVNGVKIKYFNLEDDGLIDFNELNDAISDDINLIYFVNPNNPTGIAYPINEINALVKKNSGKYFLIDEAYSDFWGQSMVKVINDHTNIIITKTMSKSFGLAGFRFGYCLSSKDIINQLNAHRNPKDINTLSLIAVNSMLDNINIVTDYISNVKKEKEIFINYINSVNWVYSRFNSETNFLLLKVESEELKMKFIDYLQTNNIYVRNFDNLFNSRNYLRISIGNSKSMKLITMHFNKFNELLQN